MKIIKTLLVLSTLSFSSIIFAKAAAVDITGIKDGAKIMSNDKNKISYEATPGPNGDHVHLYVDNKDPVVLRNLKGSYTLEKLEAGNRDICIKLVDKNHTPVGVEKCIKVTVE